MKKYCDNAVTGIYLALRNTNFSKPCLTQCDMCKKKVLQRRKRTQEIINRKTND